MKMFCFLPTALTRFLSPALCLLTIGALADQTVTPPSLIPPTTTLEALVNPNGLTESARLGWHTDFIGPFRGVFDSSVGFKLWPDRFNVHNFIFGGSLDLASGLRARVNLRRQEGETHAFEFQGDEVYLEAFNQYRGQSWDGGASLKFGHVRYLHFPYPDAIAQFDQVPGNTDFHGGPSTDYRDLVLSLESGLHSGWGAHYTGRAQVVDGTPLSRTIEAYGFYRHDFGRGWRFESRAGALAVRVEPLGRGAEPGASLYFGKQLGEFNVGVLYEAKQNEATFTGIMLQLRPTRITKLLGRYDFDYSRQPEGFTIQVPILHLRANESTHVRPGDMLVGEVRAVRMRTLWQQGFVRNEYEHRLESWGETTDPKLHCVVTEEPWFLQTEALVSRHIVPDVRWEHDRQGPGQYVQRVTYRYYRLKPKIDNGA